MTVDLPRPARISIDVIGLNDLTVAEVWPDGDQPDIITADEVAKVMDGDQVIRILQDWNLDVSLRIVVDAPNPHYTQAEVLIPEFAPPARYVTETEVG